MTTNGSLINSKNAKEIAQLVDDIRISIEGSKQVHNNVRGENSFQKAVNGAFLLRKYSSKLSLQMVVSKKSYTSMKNLIDLAQKIGIFQVIYQPFQSTLLSKRKELVKDFLIREEKELERLAREIEETINYAREEKIKIFFQYY